MTLDLVVRATRAVFPDGERAAAIGVLDGRVAVIAAPDAPLSAGVEHRVADDAVLLPGLVDTHVHLQDPGHPDWETLPLAAAAGGITTPVDMPLDPDLASALLHGGVWWREAIRPEPPRS